MTIVTRGEVDGIATFWVDSGRPTLTASLMFRCGSADEPATESGWQHLLEHLALHDRTDGGQLSINGEVSLHHTTFDAHGPAAEVAAHLTSVTEWLNEPAFARLDTERRVLAAEAAQRGTAGVPNALSMRFGASGPGVVAFGEIGLGRATPELLTERSRTVFTRENAVLMLDGPPPGGWRLPLPSGQLHLPKRVTQIEECPAGYIDAGLMVSGLIRRTPAATILPEVIRRVFVSEFRERLGGAYSPFCGYEYADAEHTVAYVGTDINAGDHPDCAGTARALVRTLAQRGPDAGMVAEITSMITQGLSDPYAQFGMARRAGGLHLSGEEPTLSLERVVAEYAAITPDDVQTHAVEFHESLLLGMPQAATAPQLLRMISQPTTHPDVRSGPRRKHANWPGCLDKLILDDGGTTLVVGDKALDLPHSDLAAFLTYPSGMRHLVGRDGWGLTVDPLEWSGGDEAIRSLDAWVPTHLHAPQREPSGRQTFNRASPWHRYRALMSMRDRRDPALVTDPVARIIAQGSLWVLTIVALVIVVVIAMVFDAVPEDAAGLARVLLAGAVGLGASQLARRYLT